jgi:enoyl-CoA hydratase/carnithine racemase
MTDSVLVAEHTAGEHRIGQLTLNVEKTLNSLTREMVDIITDRLEAWAQDDAVVAVVIDGAGEKAFCAGGDVQALRNSCIENPGGPCEYAEHFFAREYRMNYLLHTYSKPLICWGHGVVMGGGLGILAGCRYRVVSERTRIGMPEITIALFPDVGGSWFLNRMPGQVGRFLALTSSHINATDALYCGLGTHFLANEQKADVLTALCGAAWTGSAEANHEMVATLLAQMNPSVAQPDAQLEPHIDTINAWMAGDDLEAIFSRVMAWQGEDAWLGKARDGFSHGSPMAAAWIFRQLNNTRDASLEAVFESELVLGCNIMRHPEFAEGVRALLVDKDRNPAWAYADLASVPSDVVDTFFSAPANMPALGLPE